MSIQREPIHLHDTNHEILCDSRHDTGILTLSTHMAVMTSCPKCLDRLHDSAFTPISDDEFEALVRRARGTIARAVEPLEEWLAAREEEYRMHVLWTDLLVSVRDGLPRYALLKRWQMRRVIARHLAEYV